MASPRRYEERKEAERALWVGVEEQRGRRGREKGEAGYLAGAGGSEFGRTIDCRRVASGEDQRWASIVRECEVSLRGGGDGVSAP